MLYQRLRNFKKHFQGKCDEDIMKSHLKEHQNKLSRLTKKNYQKIKTVWLI